MAFPPPILATNRSDATPMLTNQAADHNAYASAINDIVDRMAEIESWTPGTATPSPPWNGNIQYWVNGNSQLVYLRFDIARNPTLDSAAGYVFQTSLPAAAQPTHGYHRFTLRVGTGSGPQAGQVNIDPANGACSLVDAVTGLANIRGATFYPKI